MRSAVLMWRVVLFMGALLGGRWVTVFTRGVEGAAFFVVYLFATFISRGAGTRRSFRPVRGSLGVRIIFCGGMRGRLCGKSSMAIVIVPRLPMCPPLGFGGGERCVRCGQLMGGIGGALPVTGLIGGAVVRACRCLRALPAGGRGSTRVQTIRGKMGGRCAPRVGGLACSRNGLLVGLVSERYGRGSFRVMGTFLKPFGTNFCRTFTTLFNTDLGGSCSPRTSSGLARQIIHVMRTNTV